MPPKVKKNEPSKKNEMKKKEKTVEDKTFGLKNKKGAKTQKFIQHVSKQVLDTGKKSKELEKEKLAKMTEKERKIKEKEELNLLFKPVQQLAKGVDPKSVLCAFFKGGSCKKGDKCKFSHDLTIGRKGEKRSMYEDGKENGETDTMDDWDEAKLEEVVNKKHGESNKNKPQTNIICKFFVEAVENSKYGWFWQCPNGEGCHYKHALPPGFVLKKDKKKLEDMQEQISLEELIERERAALSSKNLTKVTLESFLRWKERKRQEKKSKRKAAEDKKRADYKAGRAYGLSGREMFEFNPELMEDDDDDADDVIYVSRDPEDGEDEDEDEVVVKEINLESLSYFNGEAPSSAPQGPADRGADGGASASGFDKNGVDNRGQPNDIEESQKLDMAGALTPDPEKQTKAAIAAAMAATVDDSELVDTLIDENLFDGEDLDLVEEELDELDMQD